MDVAQPIKDVLEDSDVFVATLEWRTEDGLEVLKILPNQYHKWSNIFSREQITRLREHTKHDHKIKVMKVVEAPCGPLYGMSKQELGELREWLDRQVTADKVVKSSSSAGAPILLVGKPDGSFYLCVNYQALNKVMVKSRYPLPLMTELSERLNKPKMFANLDLKNGC